MRIVAGRPGLGVLDLAEWSAVNRDERIVAARLTQVNQEIGRYVVRVLDEDSGSGPTEYTRPIRDVEHALGAQMVELGQTLQERARVRGLVVLDGTDFVTEPEAAQEGSSGKPDIPER